ncbi:uncharacterized protein LOC142167348 [Nicotiana tabacum]|uniref:Uncharacterized protein LOC142167348 n=1 Tax=Nicotiana tabacum TaxID=4097 RepID=A0AC58SF58_TOBAC
MKIQADKNRSFREFYVGDQLFVRLQPYRKMSLKGHSYHKLSPKYFGPFQIIKKVGSVAYQLHLPPHAKIHSTFHVSQLKKHIGSAPIVPDLPVSLSPHGNIVLELEQALEFQSISKHHRQVKQVLVKWFNCPLEDSTWIDVHAFKQ